MEKLKVGVIGCGRIAQAHLAAIKDLPDLALAGVADVNARAAAAAAAQFQCAAFESAGALLAEARPEAVVIATPPALHAPLAIEALSKGAHVLCEKPFAIDSASAEAMVEAARREDRLIMMASKFRYVDDIAKAKAVIESGILGEVVLFECVFCARVDMRQRWNAQRDLAGGGVLIDNGTHAVDLARYLLGPIATVQAQHGRRVQPIDVEDTSRIYFQSESGVMGTIDLSWSIHKEIDEYVSIFGTEGMLSVGWRVSRYRQSEKMQWVVFGRGYDKHQAFKRQWRNFADSIRRLDRPVITAVDALESVRVIEAAYRSASENKWHAVAGHTMVAA